MSLFNKKYNKYYMSGEYGKCYTTEGNVIYFDKRFYGLMSNKYWYIGIHGKAIHCMKDEGKFCQIYLHRYLFADDDVIIKFKTDRLYDVRESNLIIKKINENPKIKPRFNEENYDFIKELIRLIRFERIRKNYSQRQLAELSGITRTAISNIELSNTVPNLKSLIEICNVLGIRMRLEQLKK